MWLGFNWNQGRGPKGRHCVWATICRFPCLLPLSYILSPLFLLCVSLNLGRAAWRFINKRATHAAIFPCPCCLTCGCVYMCECVSRVALQLPLPSCHHSGLLMSSLATNRQKDTNSWLRLNENCGIVFGRSLAAISFPPQHGMRECVYVCIYRHSRKCVSVWAAAGVYVCAF